MFLETNERSDIIEWKYREFDKNKDHVLDLQEMKTLNRLARKELKPKKCAKRFPNYCDKDKDNSITEEEWMKCLGRKNAIVCHLPGNRL